MRSGLRSSIVAVSLAAWGVSVWSASPQSDLDALMSRVLAKRDENWRKVQQYLLDEREEVAMVGPANIRLWGDRREYTWFIRDGVFIRSPTKANGVAVSEAQRRMYEDEFGRRARARERRDREASNAATSDAAQTAPPSDGVLTAMRQPQFIDRAYFLRFRFEGGRYAFVGRETTAGRETLRIEYYPAKLFSHEQNDQARRRRERRRDRNEDVEAAMEGMMNKVSLVTLWIEPRSEQVVRYTFDNVDLDFLPTAWLMRVTDLKAEMTMGQPFPDVWLPSTVELRVGALMAAGAVDMHFRLEYLNYREATTTGRMIGVSGR